jgi:hypothetical protein
MYRSGLVDTLVTHANANGVWPNFLVWSPPWLYASSVKNKTSKKVQFIKRGKSKQFHLIVKIPIKFMGKIYGENL